MIKRIGNLILLCLMISVGNGVVLAGDVGILKEKIKKLEAQVEQLKPRVKFTETITPRGTPDNVTQRNITVSYPEHASNVKISAYMKNEPWGGHTGKPNTDDLGSTDYRPCGLGVGECSISWSKVSTTTTSSADQNGYVTVSAIFYNWAHRNDRTGKLEVTYSLDDDK